jgi:putative endonuclease
VPVVAADRPEHSAARRNHSRRRRGQLGEDLAARHLQRRGYSIVDRNVRSPRGEIDLIAFDGHTLVFAEVKTLVARSGSEREPTPAPSPLEGLRPRQRARLRRLAVAWLSDARPHRPTASELRFDAIGVLIDERGRLLRLDHLEAAW